MDLSSAWPKAAKTAKSITDTTTNTLDALSPTFAPFAARWDVEADRRKRLRTEANLKALMEANAAYSSARVTAAKAKTDLDKARATSKPLSAARRASATADKGARQHRKQMKSKLKVARQNYPDTLTRVAAKVHAIHAVPSSLFAAVAQSPWPASASVAIVAGNVGWLWLGRRTVVAVAEDGGMTAEERRLAGRLDPSFWAEHAADRGLDGTLPTPAQLTESGLVAHVRLDDKWTPKAFKAKADEIRALLGARTDLRIEIKAGSHGDRSTITLRTRSAADGIDLSGWHPGAPWGVDTVTGDPVMVPLGRRMLVAGASGSGKSWSTRALLGEASEYDDHRLVLFDLKRVEAVNWRHRARTGITPDEILDVSDDLVAELHERLATVPRGKDVIEISPERPRITLFVDEGGELIQASKVKGYEQIIENLRTLARMGRAAEIIIIWATQKPTMSGEGHGIDSQIAAQVTVRTALYLSTSTESQTVFGPDAIEKGWHAHELPERGVALLRMGAKGKTHPIKTRAFSPADVIALPDRPIWRRTAAVPAPDPERSPLTLVKPAVEAPVTNRDRVLQAVREGVRTARDITDRTGMNSGTVSREIKALIAAGLLVKGPDGMITAATEVSA